MLCVWKKLRRWEFSSLRREGNSQIWYKRATWIKTDFQDDFCDLSWRNPRCLTRSAWVQQFMGLNKRGFFEFLVEKSSLLFSTDPKSNILIGMKVAHEDSSIRRSLHSSIFILTLTSKKTQSKLLNPSWAVPQGSVFAIWWRGLSCHKISTSTSPDKVSLAGSERT